MNASRSNIVASANPVKHVSVLTKYQVIDKPVGEGTYGVVFKCRELDGNGFVVSFFCCYGFCGASLVTPRRRAIARFSTRRGEINPGGWWDGGTVTGHEED